MAILDYLRELDHGLDGQTNRSQHYSNMLESVNKHSFHEVIYLYKIR